METTLHERALEQKHESLLRPLLKTGKPFLAFCGAMGLIVLWGLYAWIIQLTHGLGVTAMRTPVGATWGVYIINFVFFACMAHGGMAVSAAVNLFKAERLRPIARMGEVLTIVTISMAGFSIVIDMGRPDRVFNMVRFWPDRVGSSPLSWDITVIILYFMLSASFLWMSMRRDLARLQHRVGLRGQLYRFLLVGYKPEEDKKIDRLAFWLSIAIVFLILMLSGGVIPWIFGLLPSQSGWYTSLAGPYFLTAALSSSMGAVTLAAALLRKVFGWQDRIKPEIFKSLGVFLGLSSALYIYMTFAQELTANYAGPSSEIAVSEILIRGQLAPLYWSTMIGGFVIPVLMLLAQAIRPRWFSLGRTVAASVVLVVAFWAKRFIIIIPSLLRPQLPFPTGTYSPTWIEWSIIAATFALALLLYAVFIKLFPIVEAEDK